MKNSPFNDRNTLLKGMPEMENNNENEAPQPRRVYFEANIEPSASEKTFYYSQAVLGVLAAGYLGYRFIGDWRDRICFRNEKAPADFAIDNPDEQDSEDQ